MDNTFAAYKQKAEAQIEKFQAEVDKLKAKTKDATADMRISWDDKIHDLESRIAEGKQNLDEVRNDHTDGWEQVKDKVEGIFAGIREKLTN